MRHPEPRPSDTCRAPELNALLHDLDELRLSLSADLSLAAAAVEAGALDLAAAVLDGDRRQVHAFERQALAHLEAAEQLEADVPAPRSVRRAVLLPAAPALAAAAAVLGVLAGFTPIGSTEPPPRETTRTAMASYAQLTRLTLDGADSAAVARAAERLHDELAAIVAHASTDPVAAQEALALLESEALVLDSSQEREQLHGVIAEARALVARLRAALPASARVPRTPAPPRDLPMPPRPADLEVSPSAIPVPPQARPEPTPEPSEEPPPREPSPSERPPDEEQPPPDDGPGLPGSVISGG